MAGWRPTGAAFTMLRTCGSGCSAPHSRTWPEAAAASSGGNEEVRMRRVVVTGMGIVSSIGNNTQEGLASLHSGRSGISRAEKYAELGFRSQVQGAPTLIAEEMVDRRAMRFHGGGTAWNYVAMDQETRDSGLGPDEVCEKR